MRLVFVEQSLGSRARLGVICLRPDRKRIKPAEAALKLPLQVLVAVAALLHEQQPDPVPAQAHPLCCVMAQQPLSANTGEPSSPSAIPARARKRIQICDPRPQPPVT